MEYRAPGTVFWSHGAEPTTSLGCGIPGPGGVARLKRGSLVDLPAPEWDHPQGSVTALECDFILGRNQSFQSRVASCPLAAPLPLLCPYSGAHRCVGDCVGAKGGILAGEGTARSGHQAGAAGTGTLVGDKAVRPWPVGRGR